MHFNVFIALTTTFLVGLVFCDSKFIEPPNYDSKDPDDNDFGKNRRYVDGETIPLKWKTDLDDDDVSLWLRQFAGSNSEWIALDLSRTEWKVEYDVRDALKNGEDTMYYFAILDNDDSVVAESVYINVTAPRKAEIETVTATATVSQIVSRLETTPTVESTSDTSAKETLLPSEETGSGSESGMTQGEVAGAAVGATLGGLLIFGGMGWLIWKRWGRDKSDSDIAATPQNQEVPEAKAELPGDDRAFPFDYARSPTGIYEAP